jgi:hypothetical protein
VDLYLPNFDIECHECGASPTVVVRGHIVPDTALCGPHFFSDRTMVDWTLWNEPQEATE